MTTLLVGQPLDLARTLQSGQAFRWRPVAVDGGEWWHGFLGDEPVLLQQRAQRASKDVALDVRCRSGAEDEVVRRLRSYFRLGDDLPATYRRLRRDPHLADAVARLHGMRLLRQEPWECLVGFLCSGHNNVKRIMLMMERMADAYGTPAPLYGVARNAFPTPERLTKAGERALRGLRLGFRAAAVAHAAQAVAVGSFPLAALREWPYERAKAALVELPGVGEKIADCVLLCSLEKPEAFPVDRWVRRAVEEWYGVKPGMGRNGKPRKEATHEEICAWARARFGRDAGYANQYLFQGRRTEEREVGGMRRVET
ncbi:MAG: hypothetical protein EXR48_05360 [Dehalococcoidia bacterium]|nr:hypothetical protein [Dehalococcoidia bacterium]